MEALEIIADWFTSHFKGPANFAPRPFKRKKPRIKTGVPAVVFSGSLDDWKTYLETPQKQRYDRNVQISIHIDKNQRKLEFLPGNMFSRDIASILTEAFQLLLTIATDKPFIANELNDLMFSNPANHVPILQLHCSSILPTNSTREVILDDSLRAREVNIVVKQELLFKIINRYKKCPPDSSPQVKCGILWPLLNRLHYQLGYPNLPRDRFVDKIAQTTRACKININLLFSGKDDSGNLKPTELGQIFLDHLAKKEGLTLQDIFQQHPSLNLLKQLSFMLNDRLANAYEDLSHMLVREYLDSRYLRPSIAEIMPDVALSQAAMPFTESSKKVKTPSPEIGKYGILDEEDLAAWKKVRKKFRNLDYYIIRQLGIGDFGRVYEAINKANPALPKRVAIKVDRIYKKERNKAIQAADMIMQLSKVLANAPHIIRIFDTGILEGEKYTYHILQLVDGETLDNLVGVTGEEHASLSRPDIPETNLQHLKMISLKSIQTSAHNSEGWRRARAGHPFTDALTLRQLLDLIISLLLTIEEVHNLGYVINDLKNGNIMLNRNGQLKGIDLDSFTKILSPQDKVHDFIFLSFSLLLLICSTLKKEAQPEHLTDKLQGDPDVLVQLFLEGWNFEDIAKRPGHNLTNSDVCELFCGIIYRSKGDIYIKKPLRFSEDIDQLIRLKRLIYEREIVLD